MANFVRLFVEFGVGIRLSDMSSHLAMGQVLVIRYHRSRPTTLLQLAAMTRSRQATDHRDKLYSLIAIASDSALLPYQPDYRIAVGRVYQDFTVAWIAEYEALDVLSLCVYSEDAPVTPSWVPNFARSKDIPSMFENLEDHFKACGPYDESKRLSVRNNTLSAPGLLLGKIATSASRSLEVTARIGDLHKFLGEGTMDQLHVLREALQITTMPCWKSPEPIRKQAFWRTLLGGRWTDYCRLRQHHEIDFNTYWDLMQHFNPGVESDSTLDDYDLVRVTNVETKVIEMPETAVFACRKAVAWDGFLKLERKVI